MDKNSLLADILLGLPNRLGGLPEYFALNPLPTPTEAWESIKRLPGIAGNALAKGVASGADFFWNGPIIKPGNLVPDSPLPKLPEAPVHDFLKAHDIISDTREPQDARERILDTTVELAGAGAVTPASIVRGGAQVAKRLGTALEHAGMESSALKQRGMFIPPSSKKVTQAEAMAAKGASREEIWDKLLLYKGPEGKWRTEIDDSQARLNPKGWEEDWWVGRWITTPEEVTPELALKHPALYKAHPDIRQGPRLQGLRYGPEEKEIGGGYLSEGLPEVPEGRLIRASAKTAEGMKSTLLHELQHDIQHRWGFATGGNPSEGIQDAVAASQDFIKRAQRLMAQESNAPKLDELLEQVSTGKIDGPTFEREYERIISSFKHGEEIKRLNEAAGTILRSPQEAYRKLAGEAEARNVQTRMDWTPEQRRATPPWLSLDVPEDELIVSHQQGLANALENPPVKRAGKLWDTGNYHGTNADFDVIDPNRYGSGDYRYPMYQHLSSLGTWTTKDKPSATVYAEHAVEQKGGHPVIRDYWIRRGKDVKHGTIEFGESDFKTQFLLNSLEDAKKEGYQVVTVKNVPRDFEGGGPLTELQLVFKGNEFLIRDPGAKFNKKKLNESGLILGLSGLGLTFGGFINRDGAIENPAVFSR
jgi:hypothetical protein